MLCKKILAVWLVHIILTNLSLLGPAVSRPVKQGYGSLLHPFSEQAAVQANRPGLADQTQQQQQQMLQALHRHQHQDMRIMIHQQQQTVQQGHTAASAAHGTAVLPQPAPAPAKVNLTDSDVLHTLHEKWPDGYLAVCAVVKDQNRDLRYWIEYHRWLGVSKFYIMDNNSTMPALMVLWNYIQQGVVDYQYFVGKPRRKPEFGDTNQYKAYQGCLLQHFRQHRWLAYIDIDEFFVLPPGPLLATPGWAAAEPVAPSTADTVQIDAAAAQLAGDQSDVAATETGTHALRHSTGQSASDNGLLGGSSSSPSAWHRRPSLPLFLSKFEQHAAVGVNWVMFGSSGLQQRPLGGPFAGYTACVPREHWESSHVKVIANTGGILGMGPTPHEVVPRPGRSVVDVDGQPFKGPKTPHAKWHKLVIHHYVLKSRAEFASKKARGSGAGNVKDWSFFSYMDNLSNSTCNWGKNVSRAFFSSKPRLKPSRTGHPCSMRSKHMIAATSAAPQEADEQRRLNNTAAISQHHEVAEQQQGAWQTAGPEDDAARDEENSEYAEQE